jgi:CheY-like chemotaxis protein
MAALLGRWGVRVLAARTIGEAENLAAAERPDVILADFHLRESESGLDALRRLAAMNGGRPGALVTANASMEVVAGARAAGFEMLRKPVKPAALRALLAAFARRKVAGAGSSVAAAQARAATWSSASCCDSTTAWVRLVAPSFCMMAVMCALMVASDTPSS